MANRRKPTPPEATQQSTEKPKLPALDRGGDAGPDAPGRPEREACYVPLPVEDGKGKVHIKMMHVARVRQPAVIKMLSLGGSHALNRYIHLGESLGAVTAIEADAPVDGGKLSDGGVTRRVADAAELRRAMSFVKGVYVRHPSGKSSSIRQPIPVLTVLNEVGVMWKKPKEILTDHRWGCRSDTLMAVNQAFGWSVMRLKVAFGIEEFRRVFEPLPEYLYGDPAPRPTQADADRDTGTPAPSGDRRPSSSSG